MTFAIACSKYSFAFFISWSNSFFESFNCPLHFVVAIVFFKLFTVSLFWDVYFVWSILHLNLLPRICQVNNKYFITLSFLFWQPLPLVFIIIHSCPLGCFAVMVHFIWYKRVLLMKNLFTYLISANSQIYCYLMKVSKYMSGLRKILLSHNIIFIQMQIFSWP